MNLPFLDWVDVEGLAPGERERLERVHNLLVAVGPPAELPIGRESPPAPAAQVISFPMWRRRPMMASLAAAATLVAASFAGGFFIGDRNGGMAATEVVAFHGGQNALASLRVGKADEVGNNPMILSVSGLPKIEHGYYELFTIRDGKPSFPCTGFKMVDGETVVQFTVPYVLKPGTKLVITAIEKGKARWPGHIVMRSV
jgi:hypothetical protein